MLLLYIAAVVDLRNTAVKANLGPLIVGFSVAATGMPFGANAGYAINPDRDLGPRLFAWIAGWGDIAMPGTVDGPDYPAVSVCGLPRSSTTVMRNSAPGAPSTTWWSIVRLSVIVLRHTRSSPLRVG